MTKNILTVFVFLLIIDCSPSNFKVLTYDFGEITTEKIRGRWLAYAATIGDPSGSKDLLPELRVQFDNGMNFSLKELPEKFVKRISDKISPGWVHVGFPPEGSISYKIGDVDFLFHHSKLIYCFVFSNTLIKEESSMKVKFSVQENGRQYNFPLSENAVFELFGRPNSTRHLY